MNKIIYEYSAFYNIMNIITVSKLPFHFGEKKLFLLISHSPTQSLLCLKSEMSLCMSVHVTLSHTETISSMLGCIV